MSLRMIWTCGISAAGFGMVSVVADELSGSGRIDTDGLMRIEDGLYQTSYEDWVDTEPLMRASIKKIGYGRTSYVEISTTPTGTYSSDGLASPNILYPGIETDYAGPADRQQMAHLLGHSGVWLVTTLQRAGSVIHFTTDSGTRVVSGRSFSCILGERISAC